MRSRLKLFAPLFLCAALGFFLFRGLALDPQSLPSALLGKPFPDFSLLDLNTGVAVERSDVMGEVALFNVWATWCISCRVEHPYLEKLAKEGVRIYGINYKDEDAAARQWLLQRGDPYLRNIVDSDGLLGLDLGVYGAPETYIVDASGIVRYRHVGVIDDRVWTERLRPLVENIGAPANAP
ncbi:MAG: cytochrome c biogenesis protein CcmG/thiol:disulfide interchange protein DsbE [Halieaceae bacterium]